MTATSGQGDGGFLVSAWLHGGPADGADGAELDRVVAYLAWPARWRHRLRTTNLAEAFFRHLRKHLNRFPGCVDAAHSEQVLGCFILSCEQAHA